MRVLSLKIENILSIKEAEINFQDTGLMLVEGWNYDDGRANGAGKTAIFNALSFAIYGKLPRKVTISEVLRKGTKKAYAEAVIQADDGIYTVRRERPKGTQFKKEGQEITMTQEEFEYKIKLSYDQFLISMYTAQQSQNKFLYLNDTQKKDFLLQLMNLNEFATCKREADLEIKALDEKINEQTIKLEKAKSKIDAYSESTGVEHAQETIGLLQSEIDALKVQAAEDGAVVKPDLSKFYKLEADIQSKLEELATIRAMRNREFDEFAKLERSIHPFEPTQPDASCPHCRGQLMVQGKSVSKPDDVELHKRNHENKMNEIKEQMRIKKGVIDDYDAKLQQDSQLRNLLNKTREKRESESREYNQAQKHYASALDAIRHKESLIISANEKIQKAQELKDKIEVLKKYSLEAVSVIDQYNASKEIYKTISNMYAPTGAPAYIMDSIVDSFNEIVSEYISLVWPNAAYELQSHKESKSGSVTAKFSESLVINGKQRSIGSLSGGEQRALSLAIDFAVADILSQQFGIPLNPVVMDEPFEGLDATGREIVIELLNKLSTQRQIWVIDHASEAKSMFSQVIRVEKQNGVSRVVS